MSSFLQIRTQSNIRRLLQVLAKDNNKDEDEDEDNNFKINRIKRFQFQ